MAGKPNPPENLFYGKINAMGSFTFSIAGAMYRQEDDALTLYLTNPEENEAYLMCEVFDSESRIIYRSGLLRPGEYLERLYPVTIPDNEDINIEIKIYALEPENFYSVGTVTLANVLLSH